MAAKKTLGASGLALAVGVAGGAIGMRTIAPPQVVTPMQIVEVPIDRPAGDGTGDGRVDFDDINATLANWLFGYGVGDNPPSPPMLVQDWWRSRGVKVYSMIARDDGTPLCIAMLEIEAEQAAAELGGEWGGHRGVSFPGHTTWPPPGSYFERVYDAWHGEGPGGFGEADVEAACHAIWLGMQREAARQRRQSQLDSKGA